MKKFSIIFAVIIAFILATVLLISPYYFGIKTEQSLNEQQGLLAKSDILTIDSREYNRGWFSSTEKLIVRFNPKLLHNLNSYLPENLKPILDKPVTLINHIKHGPYTGNGLARASIKTEFIFNVDVKKTLTKFFLEQDPISLSNTIYFNGNGNFNISIPKFEYEELSGIQLNWDGLTGEINYKQGFDEYDDNYSMPRLFAKLADQGSIEFKGLTIKSNNIKGNNNLMLGQSSTKLDSFATKWNESIDYNVRINDLINLVSDLQLGAFINPNGTVTPSFVNLHNLSFENTTKENNHWIDAKGRFQFDSLEYGKDKYGPLDIAVESEHLDAKSLLSIKNKLNELTLKNDLSEQNISSVFNIIKPDVINLLINSPVFKILTFKLDTPDGLLDLSGALKFASLTEEDFNSTDQFVSKTDIDIQLNVPQALLETIFINQIRSLFSVNEEDLAEGKASIDDINETLKSIFESNLRAFQNEGYLSIENGLIKSNIKLQNKELTFNGKPLKLIEEPTFTDDDLLPESNNNQ